ncbi:MAG: hypothetical protein IPK07_19610 [Deltaproteobacteria bacterium]|nr:hypothetical protein [Deltaproteobacteria bacterium]
MPDLDLSPEELNLVERLAHERQGARQRLAFYAVVLAPLVAFAVHGVRRSDLDAVAVAFGGLLLFNLWHLAEELRQAPRFQSIFRKVSAHRHGQPGRPDGPAAIDA